MHFKRKKVQRKKDPQYYDHIHPWVESETDHFILKFSDSILQNALTIKIPVFENAFLELTSILKVKPNQKLKFYFVSDIRLCIEKKILLQAAVPHLHLAVIFPNDTDKPLINIFRHELVHLLAYFWDFQMYHVEMLEEGLAGYLADPRIDYHQIYVNKFNRSLKKDTIIDISLMLSDRYLTTNYSQAISFVKFLTETYGFGLFKMLHISSAVDRQNGLFKLNGQKMPATHLYKLLEKVYHTHPLFIHRNWIECLVQYL